MAGLITDGTYALNTVNNHYNLNTTAPLTGDGSVDAPLGFSNETILYSSTADTASNPNPITLSESVDNFRSIKLYFAASNGCTVLEWEKLNPTSRTCYATYGCDYAGSATIVNVQLDITGNKVSAVRGKTVYGAWGNTSIAGQYYTTTGNVKYFQPIKVVGINRTANN